MKLPKLPISLSLTRVCVAIEPCNTADKQELFVDVLRSLFAGGDLVQEFGLVAGSFNKLPPHLAAEDGRWPAKGCVTGAEYIDGALPSGPVFAPLRFCSGLVP